jgi:ketosteroid isomerase-like protein
MASANVELVRSIFSDWERGHYTTAEWADPEIDYVIVGGPAPGRWVGVSGMWQGWRGVLDAWEELRFEAEEYRELDGERVLVLYRWTGRGKASGVDLGDVQAKGANLLHIRDGRVTRLVGYFERDRALADLGLAPESD